MLSELRQEQFSRASWIIASTIESRTGAQWSFIASPRSSNIAVQSAPRRTCNVRCSGSSTLSR